MRIVCAGKEKSGGPWVVIQRQASVEHGDRTKPLYKWGYDCSALFLCYCHHYGLESGSGEYAQVPKEDMGWRELVAPKEIQNWV